MFEQGRRDQCLARPNGCRGTPRIRKWARGDDVRCCRHGWDRVSKPISTSPLCRVPAVAGHPRRTGVTASSPPGPARARVVVSSDVVLLAAMVTAVSLSGVPLAVVNPRRSRDLPGCSVGAKTDAIVPGGGRFGEVTADAAAADDAAPGLTALVHRRGIFVECCSEKKPRSFARPPYARRTAHRLAAARCCHADTGIAPHSQSPVWRDREQLLRSVRASGPGPPSCC